MRTGVFVIGDPKDVARQRNCVATVFDLPVPVHAVAVGNLAGLARHLVGTASDPRPQVLNDQQVGRIAARLRLGGRVRILGA